MKINKSIIPQTALVNSYLPANYADAYECEFAGRQKITADDFMIVFWTNSPRWVSRLFALRDWLVKPFGIRPGSGWNKEKLETAIRSGGQYGFVNVVAKSANETVISANDKHLKMYFSVKVDEADSNRQRLTVSTVVHFHNWLGYVYFYSIYPFHHLVVRGMLRYSLKTILFSTSHN